MTSPKPLASLSLDLDNHWSYLRTRGDPAWVALPSFLDLVVPRILGMLDELGLKITFFIVGQDAALPANRQALASIARAGHEIGNHSFKHEPWLHRYSADQIEAEIARAETAIEAATERRPIGFRGPGFSLSTATLEVLQRRGYRYDATTFPTFIGPLARAFYFRTAELTDQQRAEREALFGAWSDGLRPLRPYHWDLPGGRLLEVPVTTMPVTRTPFHASYLLWLAGFSPVVARAYFGTALRLCRLAGVQPSLLLHGLDFLGGDDVPSLAFFPAMRHPAPVKLARMRELLATYSRPFQVVPLGAHAAAAERDGGLARVRPRLREGSSWSENAAGSRRMLAR